MQGRANKLKSKYIAVSLKQSLTDWSKDITIRYNNKDITTRTILKNLENHREKNERTCNVRMSKMKLLVIIFMLTILTEKNCFTQSNTRIN